jgi:uncharacterized protein
MRPSPYFLLASMLFACGGAGAPAQAIRPKAQTAAQASGEPAEDSCREVSREGKPLVVDWKPEQRGDLEIAMTQGIAVVNYDCKRLELLSDCRAEGTYGFKGVVLKQQLIRLNDSDELKVNLPLSGPLLAVKLEGQLGRGTTLDLATALVGNRMSTRTTLARDQLVGRCEGATHFVRGANIGAFVMQTGEESKVMTAAQVFGAGAQAGSASSKLARQEDGDIESCKQASSDLDKPPGKCGALVRLHLVSINAAAPKAEAAPNAKFVGVQEEEPGCPTGFLYADGKCMPPRDATEKHVCQKGDVPDCTKQCDADEGWSCSRLGSAVMAQDAAKAATLYKKSCALGHPGGCSNLGLLLSKGTGVTKDDAEAAKMFAKACEGGDAVGCFNLGAFHFEGRGVGKDEKRAVALFKQSCDGGNAAGCINLGAAYDDGTGGVAKDPARALTLFKRACEGDRAEGCTNVGVVLSARNSGDDAKNAVKAYARGCDLGSAKSCDYLGKRYLAGTGVDKDPSKAKDLMKRACDLGLASSCGQPK